MVARAYGVDVKTLQATSKQLMPGAMVLANPLLPECTQTLTLLSGQIIECLLKAFLSKSGVEDENLKIKLSHNLLELCKRAATEGLPM